MFSTPRGKVRPRTLYWFRSPPNLKVGRAPFDEEVMRTLEAQHPELTFDWEALRRTPMPPPSAEYWRERRRADKAMRQFRAADESDVAADEGAPAESTQRADRAEARELSALADPADAEALGVAAPDASDAGARSDGTGAPPSRDMLEPGTRRRRRRRRGRERPSRGEPQRKPEDR